VGARRLGNARAALAADDTLRAHDAIAGADLRTGSMGFSSIHVRAYLSSTTTCSVD
jgi:hypothetical protein